MRPRVTYANVVATLALFIALGGASAFAASQLGKNTVGTKQLKANSVTAAKIKDQAVGSAKLADGAVTAAQLAPGVAISGPQGTQGPPGPPGVPPPVEAPKVITSFLNGWSALKSGGNVVAPVRYWKDPSGVVHLEGIVSNTNHEFTWIFRLPEGYRPEANSLNFTVASKNGIAEGEPGFISIEGDNDPEFWGIVEYRGGNSEFISLDGVTFRAES